MCIRTGSWPIKVVSLFLYIFKRPFLTLPFLLMLSKIGTLSISQSQNLNYNSNTISKNYFLKQSLHTDREKQIKIEQENKKTK